MKNWTFNNESFPEATDYKWRMEFNPLATENGSYYMVPKQPNDTYGDLTSLSSLNGQNTAPPSEKVFPGHIIVKVTVDGVTPPYYDPSYGKSYLNADDFENQAVNGYRRHFPGDDDYVFRLKSSVGLKNIQFDK